MILLSDGKANYSDRQGDSYRQTLEEWARAAALQFPALVVDTDTGVFSPGLAKELASRKDAFCVQLV